MPQPSFVLDGASFDTLEGFYHALDEQVTIERTLGIRDGFWGLLAHGGWFPSVPGRRPTPQGRAIVRAHYAALVSVEGTVNRHYLAWQRGEATPLKPALDAMYARWLAVRNGERLALEWPVLPLPDSIARSRPHRAGRRGRGRAHHRASV